MNINQIQMWCTYHNPQILIDYNLQETENFKLFNTDDFTLKEDNINYLHDYLGELTTYYYVWKNQLKSDYVGFCQYRRHWISIYLNELEKHGIYAYMNWQSKEPIYKRECGYHNILNDFYTINLINYMYHKYNIDIRNYLFEQENRNIAYHNMLIYRWDVFEDVCDFAFGFLDYLSCGKWKNTNNIIFLSKLYHFKHDNENEYSGDYYWERALSVLFEIIIGIYVNIKYTVPCHIEHMYYIYLDEKTINNFEEFDRWYKMNIKTGVVHFYVNDNIRKILDDNKLNYMYIRNDMPYIGKEIKLKINERIHCENSIEFNKGNFHIEKY